MKKNSIRRVIRLLLLFVVIQTATRVSMGEKIQDNLGWRSVRNCGVNCLYIMLFMNGKKVEYSDLLAESKITDRGMSVAELQRVSEAFGLPLNAHRTDPSMLASIPLPAIVHFENDWQEVGHFVLLVRVNQDGTFTIIEPTLGEIERYSRGNFYSKWSGILLTRNESIIPSQLNTILTISSGMLISLVFLALAPRRWSIYFRENPATTRVAGR